MVDKVGRYLGNLWIQYPTIAYRNEVERDLKMIRTTKAGEVLIKAISAHTNFMVIAPFVPTPDDLVNAYADVHHTGNYNDSLEAGWVQWGTTQIAGLTLKYPTAIGTGRGTGALVDYHPATWKELARRRGFIGAGAGGPETLFHEMTHAHRKQAGLTNRDAVVNHTRFDTYEEFCAILAANIYRSERGFTKLRRDHQDYTPMDPALANSDAYYTAFKTEIDKWFAKQEAFCLGLAGTPAKFNPLRSAAIALGKMTAPTPPPAPTPRVTR